MNHTPPHSERNRAAEAIKKANEALPLDSPHRLTEAEVAANFFATNTTPPHVRDSETSLDAAVSIQHKVPKLQRQVLDCIAASPAGHTCDEVECILGLAHQTCSARFRELATCQPPLIEKLLLEDGSYARRKTRSGRGAYVYIASEEA